MASLLKFARNKTTKSIIITNNSFTLNDAFDHLDSELVETIDNRLRVRSKFIIVPESELGPSSHNFLLHSENA